MSGSLTVASTGENHEPPNVRAMMQLAMVPGIGPLTLRALLDHFGSAASVLAAAPSQLREVPGVGAKLSQAIAAAAETIDVDGELARCAQRHIHIVYRGAKVYPRLLREIYDPPEILFIRGQLEAQDELAIAVVGTRHATRYGVQQAERLAASLSRAGVTIVSGLARGIDSAAHRGALDAGGRTVAVLAGGLIEIYPREHSGLADQIVEHGALVSEMPTLTKPRSGAFPRRNRLIAGMTLGVVVVEAGRHSGALITARLASEQGREVFAVPGPVDSRASLGCHQLLRDGAKLVESADDVLSELGPLVAPVADARGYEVHHPAELQLNQQERAVLEAIDTQPTSLDDVAAATEIPIHRVLSTVSVLEMRHLIRRVSGTMVARIG